MKAKCPYCINGCVKCENGYTNVSFATGNLFTRKCTSSKCGNENGGRIVDAEIPPESPGKCVWCGEPAIWLFICNMDENDADDLENSI